MIRYAKTLVLEFTVLGHQPRKSNSRRPGANGRWIKSELALKYADLFISQVLPEWQLGLTVPCRLEAVCYYKNKLSDLSDELLADLCEKCDIIIDDNLFKEKELQWQFDSKRPRVEVSIFQLEGFPTQWLKKSHKKSLSTQRPRKKPAPKGRAFLASMATQERQAKGKTPRMTQKDLDALLMKKETTAERKSASD